MEELMRYASFHFFSEETQMAEVGFPEREHHHDQHRMLLLELNEISSRVEMGGIDDSEVIDFLKTWFLDHTVQEDAKIAEFMGAKS